MELQSVYELILRKEREQFVRYEEHHLFHAKNNDDAIAIVTRTIQQIHDEEQSAEKIDSWVVGFVVLHWVDIVSDPMKTTGLLVWENHDGILYPNVEIELDEDDPSIDYLNQITQETPSINEKPDERTPKLFDWTKPST